jgi:hypothetical protein
MRKEVRDYWLIGIKSNTYKKGKSFLRTPEDTYCFLGILADLSVIYGGVTRTLDKTSYLYDGYRESLPPKTVEWAGLKNTNGYTPYIGKSFTMMNDQDVSWSTMQKYVEKYWEQI